MLRVFVLITTAILSISIVQAQRLCEALVENALEQAGENCREQDGELVCYAYDSLSATFFDAFADNFSASSRIGLPDVHTLQSSEVDLEEDEWGIAYTQIQSNLPAATSNSAIRLIMMGDVLLENTVNEELGVSLDSVLVTVSEDTSLRDVPDASGEVINDVTSGILLEAVGQSADGGWIGVTVANQIAWIEAGSLTSTVDLSNLPDVSDDAAPATRDAAVTAFDNLFFQTGGESECQEAPNILVVQGPEDQSVDVTLNNVPIRIGSTISVGTDMLNGEPVMFVVVISGEAILYPDTPDAVILQPLEVSYAPVSAIYGDSTAPIEDYVTGEPILRPDGTFYLRLIPEDFIDPIPLTLDGVTFLSLSYYDTIYLIPESLLNYLPEKPEPEPEPPVVEQTTTTSTGTTNSTSTTTTEPSVAETVTDSCNPDVLNYCNAGQPWGDGRCISMDSNITAYYYQAGWYQAAYECGVIDKIPSAFDPSQPQNVDISCTATLKNDSTVSWEASWGSPARNQAELVFQATVKISNSDEYQSYEIDSNGNDSSTKSVTINDSDTSASGSKSYSSEVKEIKSARVWLEDFSGSKISSTADCTIRN